MLFSAWHAATQAAADATVQIDGHAPRVLRIPTSWLVGIEAQAVLVRLVRLTGKIGISLILVNGAYPNEVAPLHHMMMLYRRQGITFARLGYFEPGLNQRDCEVRMRRR